MLYHLRHFGGLKNAGSMIAHHALFFVTFFVSQLAPTSLGMMLYFWFCFTELSTPCLHLQWFMHKAGPRWTQSKMWRRNGITLLAMFVLRIVVTAISVPYALGFVIRRRGRMEAALATAAGGEPLVLLALRFHLAFYACGVLVMLALNTYWFVLLVRKAFNTNVLQSSSKEDAKGKGQEKKKNK